MTTSPDAPAGLGNAGPVRQTDIYLRGALGEAPALPADYAILESRAREVMSEKAFAYVAAGAGREDTVVANTDRFARWAIAPRMLRDVSRRDLTTDLFAMRLPAPLLLAPIGVQDLAHPGADKATAEAAAKVGVPMIFSNQASVSMEDCAKAMGTAPRLFQLYWSKDRDLVASLVTRAQASRCNAIVVTLDTTMLGWRTRDLDLGYLPFLEGKGLAQYLSDPVFRKALSKPPEEDLAPAIQHFINVFSNPALTWDDLAFLRQHTRLPVLLKGILHADDARQAVDYGVDGIVVSNHGGRQVDGALAAIEALPDVAEAVGGRVPVLFDSGIRGGADMFKALALGATAVCLGRPYVYGLALGGAAGVETVVRNLLADFDLTMGLAGCRTVSEITRECLVDRERA